VNVGESCFSNGTLHPTVLLQVKNVGAEHDVAKIIERTRTAVGLYLYSTVL